MRNLIALSDEEIEKRFNTEFYIGLTTDDLVFTRDTLEDFIRGRRNYAEPGKITKAKNGSLLIERVQARKGQPRRNLCVVDFGAIRAAYLD